MDVGVILVVGVEARCVIYPDRELCACVCLCPRMLPFRGAPAWGHSLASCVSQPGGAVESRAPGGDFMSANSAPKISRDFVGIGV